MKVKRNLMLILALTALAAMLASCCWHERPSLIATPPTTAFPKNTPPVSTTITELIVEGDEETLTIKFDPERGTCKEVSSNLGKVECNNVRIEFSELFICTSKARAEWHKHEVNTFIGETSVPGLPVGGEGVYCAPIKYLSEGAIFQFEPGRGGKNISCGSSGGSAYCPR